jgi:hypothetical protein
LDAAGLEQADVADAVAMAHPALEHDRHGLEAAVRMVGEAADVVARRVAAEGIEHQERIEALLQRLGEHAGQLDAVAVGRGLAANDALDGARTEGGGRRGVHEINVATTAASSTGAPLNAGFNCGERRESPRRGVIVVPPFRPGSP